MEPVYEFGKPMLAKMPEARRIELKALATAANVEYETAAIVQMFIDKIPEIARAISEPLAKTDRIVVINNSGGDGGGRDSGRKSNWPTIPMYPKGLPATR